MPNEEDPHPTDPVPSLENLVESRQTENIPFVGEVTELNPRETEKVPIKGDVIDLNATFLQRTATAMAAGVGLVLAVMLLFTVYYWVREVPGEMPLPNPPALREIPPSAEPTAVAQIEAVNQAMVADYKALTDAVTTSSKNRSDNYVDNRSRMIDAIPTKILLPLLTLLLGYLFGIRSDQGSTNS
jgi:hypothetical protein